MTSDSSSEHIRVRLDERVYYGKGPVVGDPIPSHSAKNPFSIPIFGGSGTEERSTNYY